MKPLLILVDLQNDYLKSSRFDLPTGSLVRGAAKLLGYCRERGVPVAHVWTTVSRKPDNRMPHWRSTERWLCEEGTPGHRPPPSLEPLESEPILHKTGFDVSSSFNFVKFARRLGIDTV